MEAWLCVSGHWDPTPASELIFEYALTPVPVPDTVSRQDIQMCSSSYGNIPPNVCSLYIHVCILRGQDLKSMILLECN